MSNAFLASELLCLFPRGSMLYEEWLITLPDYLREIVKDAPENKTYQIKSIGDPNYLRTDRKYWSLILRSHGLGMNRGTEKGVSSEDEKLLKDIEDSRAVAKAKRGRPKKEIKSYFASSSAAPDGSFFGTVNFRVYDSKPHSVGTHPSARNNSVRYGSGGKGDRGMIVYIGGISEIARLEEHNVKNESGRVTPSGYGPEK